MSEQCAWTWNDDIYGGYWDTGCGEAFCFEDGTKPGDRSGVKYCCYCGKRILVRIPMIEGDELQSDDLLP